MFAAPRNLAGTRRGGYAISFQFTAHAAAHLTCELERVENERIEVGRGTGRNAARCCQNDLALLRGPA